MSDDMKSLLVEISTKLNGLIDRFDAASQGDGFSRCVSRGERIMRLEQDVIGMKKEKAALTDLTPIKEDLEVIKKRKADFDTWLMRSAWSTIIIGIIKMAFTKTP